MKRAILKEADEALKEKRKALKEKFFNLLMSDKFGMTYIFITFVLSIVYIIRIFSDSGFDRTSRIIESTVLWLLTFRYYFTKRLHPDSRLVRWWFRIIFISSVMSTIHLIFGLPGPRLPWKDL